MKTFKSTKLKVALTLLLLLPTLSQANGIGLGNGENGAKLLKKDQVFRTDGQFSFEIYRCNVISKNTFDVSGWYRVPYKLKATKRFSKPVKVLCRYIEGDKLNSFFYQLSASKSDNFSLVIAKHQSKIVTNIATNSKKTTLNALLKLIKSFPIGKPFLITSKMNFAFEKKYRRNETYNKYLKLINTPDMRTLRVSFPEKFDHKIISDVSGPRLKIIRSGSMMITGTMTSNIPAPTNKIKTKLFLGDLGVKLIDSLNKKWELNSCFETIQSGKNRFTILEYFSNFGVDSINQHCHLSPFLDVRGYNRYSGVKDHYSFMSKFLSRHLFELKKIKDASRKQLSTIVYFTNMIAPGSYFASAFKFEKGVNMTIELAEEGRKLKNDPFEEIKKLTAYSKALDNSMKVLNSTANLIKSLKPTISPLSKVGCKQALNVLSHLKFFNNNYFSQLDVVGDPRFSKHVIVTEVLKVLETTSSLKYLGQGPIEFIDKTLPQWRKVCENRSEIQKIIKSFVEFK